jgi:hypothetical protein
MYESHVDQQSLSIVAEDGLLLLLLLCRFALLCLGGLEAPLNLPIKRDK